MPVILHCQRPGCGREYKRSPAQAETSRFCSRECLQWWLNVNVRSKHKAPWLSELNRQPGRNLAVSQRSALKRSKTAARKRRTIANKTYHRKRGQFIHRRILERIAAIQGIEILPYGVVVHHIDENRGDNDESNLSFLSGPAEHGRIHGYLNREVRLTLMTLRRKNQVGRRYKFKTQPFRHQVRALKKILSKNGGALFMDMGTGKTKVAIDFFSAKFLQSGYRKVLVVCPKGVRPVWRIELRKHGHAHILSQLDIKIYNYEALIDREVSDYDTGESWIYEGDVHELLDWKPDILIVDESHRAGNPNSKQTKALTKLSQVAQATVVMTGTKTGGKVLKLFSQYRLIDPGILGTSFAQFKKRIAVWGGYNNYTLVRYINLKWLQKRVRPHTFEIMKEECLDLPSRTDEIVPVTLSPRAVKLYEAMATDSYAKLGRDELEAGIPLTRLLRLTQFESGLFRTEEGYRRFDSSKYDAALSLLSDMYEGDEKVVIFCNYIQELLDAGNAAKKARYPVMVLHGKTKEKEREQQLLRFDEHKGAIAYVIQAQTGGLGISLTAAKNAIFFGLPQDLITWQQTRDRLHRIGQHWPVTYHVLMAQVPGMMSVSQLTWLALKKKKNVEDLVLRDPTLLMRQQMEL